jgi:diaminohydroxyphosphoribosylaminopyrimidine deaminase/5-amino-6-(5-phosphoribosylamino)uracil reductase
VAPSNKDSSLEKLKLPQDGIFMHFALRLARRGYGTVSPNPMVGAVLVKKGEIIGQGWHRRAGGPHAEIEALSDAKRKGHSTGGATLYVTLEPCSTRGRTPPCTDAIVAAGIRRVVVGATDPNPVHAGRAFSILKRAGVAVTQGVHASDCTRLNEAFNHWIVNRTPFVTVKAALTLDGKLATATGESKWITGEKARTYGMQLRQGADAVLVGINTVLADNPSLTFRAAEADTRRAEAKQLRRIILDSRARTPVNAKVVSDDCAALTTIVVTRTAPKQRVDRLAGRTNVWIAPGRGRQPSLHWLLERLGAENVTSLLVEGGGEVNASFLFGGLAHRVAFAYAPKVLGGRDARKAVAGEGAKRLEEIVQLSDVAWRPLGPDLLFAARVAAP